jgi:hypothetical protein
MSLLRNATGMIPMVLWSAFGKHVMISIILSPQKIMCEVILKTALTEYFHRP